jgi:hypothetical protein
VSTGTLFLEHVRGRDFLDDGNVVIAVLLMACRESVDKSARRIRSTFADQFKGDTEKACFFSSTISATSDSRRPNFQRRSARGAAFWGSVGSGTKTIAE